MRCCFILVKNKEKVFFNIFKNLSFLLSVFGQHCTLIYSVILQQNYLQFKPQTLNQIALTDAAISMPE